MSGDAIVVTGVTKHFKKFTRKREYTTLKSELVRILKGERKVLEEGHFINALNGVDFKVPRGSTVGIVGRNGSGKSTLLKLITGIYTPTSGTIDVKGRISALLELGAGFHPDFTGRENIVINGIILGMSRAEVNARVDAIIEFAELGDFIDEPVRTYSSGMFMRLAFAVATHVDPEILIIDEILSVGDEHFQKKSQAKMNEFRSSGKTIVLVTHGLGTVESWCDYAIWIDGGKTRMAGDPRMVVQAYRQAVQMAEEQGERTGTSALNSPGAALPGAAAEATPHTVTLKPLELNAKSFGVADPLTAVITTVAQGPTPAFPVRLEAEIIEAGGQMLFASSTSIAAAGTTSLHLGRISLGQGTYTLRIALHEPGLTLPAVSTAEFTVSESPGTGPLRPVHEWK